MKTFIKYIIIYINAIRKSNRNDGTRSKIILRIIFYPTP